MRLVNLAILIAAGCAGASPRDDAAEARVHAEHACGDPAEEPPPTGQMSREAIRVVITSATDEMRRCHETIVIRGPEPDAQGRAMTSFVVERDGSVGSPCIREEQSDIRSPALHECMLRALRGLRFPEPEGDGIVRVNYPWYFTQ